MLVIPNFDEVEVRPLSAGNYDCEIVGAQVKESKRTGKAYVEWKLAVLPEKYILNYITMLEGPGSQMLKHLMHVAGEESYLGGAFDTDVLLGRKIHCELKEEAFTRHDGAIQNQIRVKKVSRAGKASDVSHLGDFPF